MSNIRSRKNNDSSSWKSPQKVKNSTSSFRGILPLFCLMVLVFVIAFFIGISNGNNKVAENSYVARLEIEIDKKHKEIKDLQKTSELKENKIIRENHLLRTEIDELKQVKKNLSSNNWEYEKIKRELNKVCSWIKSQKISDSPEECK